MKIIDILNKKANGELEDGFKFEFGEIYTYNKNTDSIKDKKGEPIGRFYCIENILDLEVDMIEEYEEIDIQGIKPFIIPQIAKSDEEDMWTDRIIINKLIKAVKKLDNKLNKERKEKLNEARQKNNTSNKL